MDGYTRVRWEGLIRRGEDLFEDPRAQACHDARVSRTIGQIDEYLRTSPDDPGLIFDDIGLWKEGISLLRRAYAFKPSSAYLHTLHSAFAHRP